MSDFSVLFWFLSSFLLVLIPLVIQLGLSVEEERLVKKPFIFYFIYLFLFVGFFTPSTRTEIKYDVVKIKDTFYAKGEGNHFINLNNLLGKNIDSNVRFAVFSFNSDKRTSWVLPDSLYGLGFRFERLECSEQ